MTTIVVLVVIAALGATVAWGVWSSVREVDGWSAADQRWLADQALVALVIGAVIVAGVALRAILVSAFERERLLRRQLRRVAPAAELVLPLEWLEREGDPARLYSYGGVTFADEEVIVWTSSSPPRPATRVSRTRIDDIEVVDVGRMVGVRMRMREGADSDITLHVRRRWHSEARRAVAWGQATPGGRG
ncbi:hypothetical protein NY547_00180 [Cnuibacter physcomitrellae]|uniref:hypothetical protein n=1 Tax=Cnuibacter physcomitrellae TaxID=1619308 RepID=UPI002175F22E|nr:hypothetical protein [Cnuibacter physcomitrellae]MCS5495654.1 hypothetical protein [Cnuibacter physcomitrellae]